MKENKVLEREEILLGETEDAQEFGLSEDEESGRKPSVKAVDDSVQAYLTAIGKHKLLTGAEEIELARRARAGDKAARAKLIQSNLRLVVNIAKRYRDHGIAFGDLIQEGTFGLMRAVDKYDPERGFRFSTYAVWWVRQSLTRAISEKSRLIRIPGHLVEVQNKMRRAVKKLCDQLGRVPTIDEISATSGLAKEKVKIALDAEKQLVSLDMSVGEDPDTSLCDMLENENEVRPEEEATRGLLKRDVKEMIDQLNPNEQAVLRVRFGLDGQEPRSLEQSGRILGFSRERVRQLESKALKKLRNNNRVAPLREYLA